MRRCPYATEALIGDAVELLQCRRRTVLGSSSWHLHAATVPYPILTSGGVSVRWRSTSAPDAHVGLPQSAEEWDDLEGELRKRGKL